MQAKLRAIQGVRSVSLVQLPPMGHTVNSEKTEIDGRTVLVYPNWIEPGYFETMGIPIRLGRTFNPGEKNAVIVSESFAREQWPERNPIGQQMGDGETKDIVVGVVGNARVNALNDDDATEQYWPDKLDDMPAMVVIVKTEGAPENLAPIVKSISGNLDSKLFPEIRLLKVLYHDKVAPAEKLAAVVSLIGLVAVLLAGVGIIGLIAFTVSQRMKEIAIRIALGAKKTQVLSAVLHQFLWPVALGMVAGTGVAATASKFLRRALYGIDNLDPLSYAAAIGMLATMLILAGLLPARRALHLDLAKALHED